MRDGTCCHYERREKQTLQRNFWVDFLLSQRRRQLVLEQGYCPLVVRHRRPKPVFLSVTPIRLMPFDAAEALGKQEVN